MRSSMLAFVMVFWIASAESLAQQPGDEALRPAADAGAISWENWFFKYRIGNANQEGLALSEVSFKGRSVLRKATVPAVRVKYKGPASSISSGCGPFADQFFSFNLLGLLSPALSTRTIFPYRTRAGDSNVVIFERVTPQGAKVLGIFVYAEIGGYRLWQGWNFVADGRIEPVVYSSGWSCRDGIVKNDHRHHPYWRLDFDIEQRSNEVWELKGEPGKKLMARRLSYEEDIARAPQEEISLAVNAPKSERHALIQLVKGQNELVDPPGKPWFRFSRIDFGVRLYNSDEDRGWEFGATGDLGYLEVPEPISNGDIVIWIAGHLSHQYVPGKDDEKNNHWHWTGPVIRLMNWD